MPTAYVTHPECLNHFMGSGHPECPERLHAIEDRLVEHGLLDLLRYVKAPQVSREQLERVHHPAYLDQVEQASPREGLKMFDVDAVMCPHTLEAARYSAGAVVAAVDWVLEGRVDNAFCAIRPPGHHATQGRAMGFCFFNNIAVGAAHALAAHGLARVAILDFDVHHGNGTEAIFRDDDRVLFCSSYRHPFYPHAPVVTDHPRIIHSPLVPGNARAQFRAALSERWLPAVQAFQPQLLLLSAGFDAHREDDMGGLDFTDEDYQWATLQIMEAAERCCHGRIVSVLEGGYQLPALARSVERHLRALMSVQHQN